MKLSGYRSYIAAWLMIGHAAMQYLNIVHTGTFDAGQDVFAGVEFLLGVLLIFVRLAIARVERKLDFLGSRLITSWEDQVK
jgi:hypothetical protein